MLTAALLVIGLLLLIVGAELLVRGASRLALAIGISPLVVGLTVVASSTSAPELAVSVRAGLAGNGDIALGNVVGSNIANVLLILGLSAAVVPLVVAQQLVRLEIPLMIGASLLVFVLGLDGAIGRMDGALFVLGIVGYTIFVIRESRRENASFRVEYARAVVSEHPAVKRVWVNLAWVVAGLGCLVLGARWLVQGAVAAAAALGVSELIVGLTIIAVGTSLPEAATSVLASLRGQRDIAVGNAVGSNLFNIFAVLGIASLVSPGGVPAAAPALSFDIPVMIAVALACLPVFFTGWTIARWEGFLFLGYYAAYVLYLILKAAEHDTLPMFSRVMAIFVLPLTAVTLVLLGLRALRANRRATP